MLTVNIITNNNIFKAGLGLQYTNDIVVKSFISACENSVDSLVLSLLPLGFSTELNNVQFKWAVTTFYRKKSLDHYKLPTVYRKCYLFLTANNRDQRAAGVVPGPPDPYRAATRQPRIARARTPPAPCMCRGHKTDQPTCAS